MCVRVGLRQCFGTYMVHVKNALCSQYCCVPLQNTFIKEKITNLKDCSNKRQLVSDATRPCAVVYVNIPMRIFAV